MSIRTSRSSKRLIAAAVAVAVTASTFAISTAAGAAGTTADPDATRFDGANRFATAGLVSAAVSTSANPVTEVILVNGRNFPDGLAASALSKHGNAYRPILLTESGSLPAETAAALKSIAGLTTVHVIGGSSVVSATVVGEVLDAVPTATINRIQGADRYATAVAAATVVSNSAGFASGHVILATGENFPDALAAGALAAAKGWPLVLNNGSALRPEVSQFISNVSNAAVGTALTVLIVGGTSVVPASIAAEINAMTNVSAQRLAGDNRYETAVAVAASVSATPAGVVLANGRNFPDALAAAAVAARVDAPILLTEAGSIPAATAAWHLENANTLVNVWAVGGTSVISADVLTDAKGAATAQVPTLTLASVTATVTTSASAVLVANQVTVSALTTGAAAGVLGNDWTVTVSATASAPGTAPVITVSNSASPCASCTDVVAGSAIIVTLATGGITAANLKAAFDASPAAAILSMAIGSGSTVINHASVFPGTLSSGQTDVAITLTFSGAVTGSATSVLIWSSSAVTAVQIAGAATNATSYIGSTAKTSGTYLIQLASPGQGTVLAQFTSGTAAVQLAVDSFSTSAGLSNAATLQVLTVN